MKLEAQTVGETEDSFNMGQFFKDKDKRVRVKIRIRLLLTHLHTFTYRHTSTPVKLIKSNLNTYLNNVASHPRVCYN